MKLSDFHFDLPTELIAKYPAAHRSDSRLMCLNGQTGEIAHQHFKQIVDHLEPGDLLVFNDTKVIPARIFGKKTTGGVVEVMVERVLDEKRMLAQVRVSKAPRIGDELLFAQDIRLTVLGREQQFYELEYKGSEKMIDVVEAIGQIPLPPYMQREPDETDKERYQTVYAKHKGSVAAPTAGLHFDQALLQALKDKQVNFAYLTLHIGAGTFAPVRTEDITQHKMHGEYIDVSAELCEQIKATKAKGKRIIAVGTTSLRSLESASYTGSIQPFCGETDIFIYPGYTFKCVDVLITNLHLPGSTLLMLVSAFAGYQHVMYAYQQALTHQYKFYSYGDAMWITKA